MSNLPKFDLYSKLKKEYIDFFVTPVYKTNRKTWHINKRKTGIRASPNTIPYNTIIKALFFS